MQALSKAKRGTYTVQWMFGIPEIIEQLKNWQIREGSIIRVIESYGDSVMIGKDAKRYVLSNEVACRVQVS